MDGTQRPEVADVVVVGSGAAGLTWGWIAGIQLAGGGVAVGEG